MEKSHIITDMDSILNIVNDENIVLFMQDFEAWLRACIRIKKVAPSTKVTNLIWTEDDKREITINIQVK